MADKKLFAAPPPMKTLKTKRPSTVSSLATTSRSKVPSTAVKVKPSIQRPKTTKNTTILGEGDVTICKQESSTPDFDTAHRQIAYGKFLRAMLEDCLVDEKIEREETDMDLQMAQLADRFQQTMDQLDKTNRRVKEINFVVEQKQLLDLKSKDCSRFYEMTDKSNPLDVLSDLADTEKACLDRLKVKNVDFGFNKESGHKQLLDAVNDAIAGFEEIKSHSNLDMNKFKEYEKSQKSLVDLEKTTFDLESVKAQFDMKFPKFSEKLIKEASENIAKMLNDDDDEEDEQ